MLHRRLTTLACLMLGCVSCADASLHVRLLIPDLYKDQVAGASLSVVVPPAGAPFSCDDIAFGNVSEEFVRANTVEEVRLRSGGEGNLDSIPREGTKLFWAQGFDDQGEPLIAGCLTFGEIQSEQTIEIIADPVTIAIIPATATPSNPTTSDPRGQPVRITDAAGQPAPGVEVRWTRTAPGASIDNNMAISDADGIVRVQAGQTPLPGPIAIDIRAKWARSTPPVLPGFLDPAVATTGTIPNSDLAVRDVKPRFQVGRFGPNGEPGLAILSSPDENNLRNVLLLYYDQSSSKYIETISDILPAKVSNLTKISESSRDRVIALSVNALVDVLPNGSISTQALTPNGLIIRSVVPLGDCINPESVQAFLIEYTNGDHLVLDGSGQVINSVFAVSESLGTPVASGCLSDGGTLHRGVVFGKDGNATLMVSIDRFARTVPLGIIPAGIGFTRKTPDEDALLLGTTLSISGTDIARLRILPVGDNLLEVEQVTSDATPTFAQSIGSGDFDGDGIADIAAALSFGDIDEESTFRIYIALGLQAAGGRVIGISSQTRGSRPQVFVTDFNGDGHDDILVVTNDSYQIFSMGEVAGRQ